MKKRNEAHELVIESLTQALLKLMEEHPLNQINVSMLCEKAGVSRISFYRNYTSMDDILIRYLKNTTDEWWQEFIKKPAYEFYHDFWEELSSEYRKNEKLIQFLYRNNVSYVLKEHIFSCCLNAPDYDDNEAY